MTVELLAILLALSWSLQSGKIAVVTDLSAVSYIITLTYKLGFKGNVADQYLMWPSCLATHSGHLVVIPAIHRRTVALWIRYQSHKGRLLVTNWLLLVVERNFTFQAHSINAQWWFDGCNWVHSICYCLVVQNVHGFIVR